MTVKQAEIVAEGFREYQAVQRIALFDADGNPVELGGGAGTEGPQGERGPEGPAGKDGAKGADGFPTQAQWDALVARVTALEAASE